MESYQFIRQIGRGTFGEVWLVKCSKTTKKYVLKQFDLQRLCKREQRSAYLEAKLLSTLKHPNIVNYLDSFYNSKGNLFLVMGYCEYGDLRSYISNRNGIYFEEKDIINWFIQICMALKYLHDKGILHRDLKTRNIFLTKTKLIKVGDLGIARVLKDAHDMATTLVGTPYYMSPEIFSGQLYNQKSDVWALGCCFYEMTTLKRAFSSKDINSLIQEVINKKVLSVPKSYSVEMVNLLTSMLEQDPEKRPTVHELLLNEFIRKYILLFLQESPVKYPTAKCHKSKDSKTKFSIGSPKDSDLAFLRKMKNAPETAVMRTVPDSNGNADGNDNSQYRAIKPNHSPMQFEVLLQNFRMEESKTNCGTRPCTQEHNASSIDSHRGNGSGRMKNSTSLPNLNTQKLKSENSFRFLSSLTHTIKQTRQKKMENLDELIMTSSRPQHFYGPSPPKSADDVYLHSSTREQQKRQSISARYVSQYDSAMDEIHGSLPQLCTTEVQKAISKAAVRTVNLPVIDSAKVECTENESNGPTANHSDCYHKLLLRDIMETQEVDQDEHIDSSDCRNDKHATKRRTKVKCLSEEEHTSEKKL